MEHIEAHTIWKETVGMVGALRSAVERGERSAEALTFCRYLQWSGILRLCKRYSEYDRHLQIDGAHLEWQVSELTQLALSLPSEKKALGPFEERVLKNLDVIAGHLLKMAPPAPARSAKKRSTSGGAK